MLQDPKHLRALAFCVAKGCLAFLPMACGAYADAEGGAVAPSSSGLVGNRAPDFTLNPVSGGQGTFSLKRFRGDVVVVDFWGTYCGPCKRSFPRLQDLSEAYAPRGLHVVGISEDEAEDKGKIAEFAETYGAKFNIGWDEGRTIAHLYKPEVMPSTYIIDRKGVVRFAHVGYRDGDEVVIRQEVEALLAQ